VTGGFPTSGAAPFDPPLALASLSGEADAEWAAYGAPWAGVAFLGGIALDRPTRAAARTMVDRDREEFLPPDPVAFVAAELDALERAPIRPGYNVRASSPESIRPVARECAARGAILEVNAHCRQDEMCAAGAGESLLREPDGLREQVRAASAEGAATSVKVRTEIDGVDLPEIARGVTEAGAEFVHVDAMDSEGVVAEVATAVADDAWVIANNEVRDAASVREYLDYGADAVSVGRPSSDPHVLSRVHRALVASPPELPAEGQT
jgi:TIM-barrel protein